MYVRFSRPIWAVCAFVFEKSALDWGRGWGADVYGTPGGVDHVRRGGAADRLTGGGRERGIQSGGVGILEMGCSLRDCRIYNVDALMGFWGMPFMFVGTIRLGLCNIMDIFIHRLEDTNHFLSVSP